MTKNNRKYLRFPVFGQKVYDFLFENPTQGEVTFKGLVVDESRISLACVCLFQDEPAVDSIYIWCETSKIKTPLRLARIQKLEEHIYKLAFIIDN